MQTQCPNHWTTSGLPMRDTYITRLKRFLMLTLHIFLFRSQSPSFFFFFHFFVKIKPSGSGDECVSVSKCVTVWCLLCFRCYFRLSDVSGNTSFLRFPCLQNMRYLGSSISLVFLLAVGYGSQTKASVFLAVTSSCCWRERLRIHGWSALPLRALCSFLFPRPTILLVVSRLWWRC